MAVEESEVLERLQFEIQETLRLSDGVFQRPGSSPSAPNQIFNVVQSNDVHVGDVYNLTINKIVPLEDRTRHANTSDQEDFFTEDSCSTTTLTIDKELNAVEHCILTRRCGLLWGAAVLIVLLLVSLIVTLSIGRRDDEDGEDEVSTVVVSTGTLLPEECGIGIPGMNDTVLQEYPWLVLIQYENQATVAQKRIFSCSGSLIHSRYVLTSAGCAELPPTLVARVRVGESDSYCNTVEGCSNPPIYVGVAERIIHPGYSRPLRVNDIALLRLDRAVNFTRTIQPVCLPHDSLLNQSLQGEVLFTAGGSYHPTGNAPSDMVKELITAFALDKCESYRKAAFEIDESLQICAAPVENGLVCCCMIGSTVLTSQQMPGDKLRSYLIGILSYRSSICDEVDIPSEYTRVDGYIPWILESIRP